MKALIPLLFLIACQGDETLTAYGAEGSWQLTELNGQPYVERATITFLDDGQVQGQAACNGYGARQTAPYPWFSLTDILSTKMACAALEAEQRFFSALTQMSLAEVSGDVLILSNDSGQTMEFTALPGA